MKNKIERLFIAFNMLVISILLLFFTILVYSGSRSEFPKSRFFIIILFVMILNFFASYIIAKIAIIPITRAWQQQLDFTANASHELRTPLSVIKSHLEIIMENETETVKQQKKWLENIESANNQLINITDNLLKLARKDNKEAIISEKKEENISLVAQLVLDLMNPIASEKNQRIEAYIEKNIMYFCNKRDIEELLTILVSNALQHNETSTDIKVRLEKQRNEIKISVLDNGIGISKKDIGKVFDRFYVVDKSRQYSTGLGLSIARMITEEHSGVINITSQINVGTEIVVLLPS